MFHKSKTPKKDNGRRILCFGSRIARSRLLPVGGKPVDYPGPFEYYHCGNIKKKYHNKAGCTLFANSTSRDKDFRKHNSFAPPVGTYDINPQKPIKQSSRPFGLGAKRKTDSKYVTPAPGTYSFFKRKVRLCTAFGHDRITVPLVRIVCGSFNRAVCTKCEQTPIGDYWHKALTNQDMCRPCMEQEWAELKKCAAKVIFRLRKKNELRTYTLVRYCEFFHEHNCTKAALQHMPTKDLIFKLRKENYLASYGL